MKVEIIEKEEKIRKKYEEYEEYDFDFYFERALKQLSAKNWEKLSEEIFELNEEPIEIAPGTIVNLYAGEGIIIEVISTSNTSNQDYVILKHKLIVYTP